MAAVAGGVRLVAARGDGLDGQPLRPIILHLDRRSYRQAQWALRKVGEDAFLNIAGNLPIPGGISATSLLWVKDHESEIYAKKDTRFGHAVTFFLKRLTDRFLIDPSNASFTGLYDTVGYGDWDERLYGPLEIERDKLPQVLMSTELAGELIDAAARALGRPVHEVQRRNLLQEGSVFPYGMTAEHCQAGRCWD